MNKSAGILIGLAVFCLYSCEPKKTPVLTSISPDNEISTVSSFNLVASGSEFKEDCQIVFNGRAKSTQYIGPTELRCEITSADMAFVPEGSLVKTVPVRVRPSDAKESNPLEFTIYGYPEFLSEIKIADSAPASSDTIRPLIDIDENGNLYVAWRDLEALNFSLSENGGDTWRTPVRITTGSQPHFRFSMGVQKTSGTVYVVWEDSDIIRFSRSTDFGESWTTPKALTQAPAWRASHPGVFIDSDGKLYVPYLDSKEDTWEFSVNILRSSDGGATFSAYGKIDWGMRFLGENCPEMGADGTGLFYIIFPSDLNQKYQTCYLAFSQDSGLSWSEPRTISQLLPAMVIDQENGINIIGSYQSIPYSYDLRFKRSVDRGETWTSYDFVDTGYTFSDIWVGPHGSTDVVWDNLFVRSFDHGSTWKALVPYAEIETASGPSMAEDSSGRVYIVWWDADGGIYFTASKAY